MVMDMPELASLAAPSGATITPDGLFFSVGAGPPSMRDLYVLERSEVGAAFGPPMLLSGLRGAESAGYAALTADGRGIYFHREGASQPDIYFATRESVSDPFGAPFPVPDLNTINDDSDPALSADGMELFFNSDRPGGMGGPDLYQIWRDCP